ncbi:hypothetical protein FIBSPDRAFT_846352 [Athelia psychrophila]|uniref:Uncharacterized protein n=1 Tax=Athelia psychrophila TaxID=1759441 RepID=A0A166WYQ1_9AGAM|nr:hypothetical protein FIBSPDRAFT_846352 [Fibularhizoctonia sp. CBS 109695]
MTILGDTRHYSCSSCGIRSSILDSLTRCRCLSRNTILPPPHMCSLGAPSQDIAGYPYARTHSGRYGQTAWLQCQHSSLGQDHDTSARPSPRRGRLHSYTPALQTSTDKRRNDTLARLREPSQAPSANANMRARLAVRGYETRNILSAAPSRRLGLSEDQEWTRAGSVQRRDGHDEAARRCGGMHDGAFHPKCECMCMSGVTLINFVVVVVGSLWLTSSHKSTCVSSSAGRSRGGRHRRDNDIEDVLHEDAAAAAAEDTHARLNLWLWLEKGWWRCFRKPGSVHGPLCTVRNPVDQHRPNRCQRDAEEDAQNVARLRVSTSKWHGQQVYSVEISCKCSCVVLTTLISEASNTINLCLLAHHGSLAGYRMMSAQLRPMIAMFNTFQKSFHFSSS